MIDGLFVVSAILLCLISLASTLKLLTSTPKGVS
jgi:hypothetical protein